MDGKDFTNLSLGDNAPEKIQKEQRWNVHSPSSKNKFWKWQECAWSKLKQKVNTKSNFNEECKGMNLKKWKGQQEGLRSLRIDVIQKTICRSLKRYFTAQFKTLADQMFPGRKLFSSDHVHAIIWPASMEVIQFYSITDERECQLIWEFITGLVWTNEVKYISSPEAKD